MSWGFWGIVTGLVLLVVNLFVCINLVSPNAGESRQPSRRVSCRPAETDEQAPVTRRQAA